MPLLVSEPTPRRPEPPIAVRGPKPPTTPRPRAPLPEPPAFRARPPGAPAVCVNCSQVVGAVASPPMCWGCGRPLCADCYWRHGLTPAAHRCTSCLTRRPEDSVAISGGRRTTPVGFSGRT